MNLPMMNLPFDEFTNDETTTQWIYGKINLLMMNLPVMSLPHKQLIMINLQTTNLPEWIYQADRTRAPNRKIFK